VFVGRLDRQPRRLPSSAKALFTFSTHLKTGSPNAHLRPQTALSERINDPRVPIGDLPVMMAKFCPMED
jgi:hypothetical protein